MLDKENDYILDILLGIFWTNYAMTSILFLIYLIENIKNKPFLKFSKIYCGIVDITSFSRKWIYLLVYATNIDKTSINCIKKRLLKIGSIFQG